MMDMQLLAGAVLKRLLVSLAIFAVGFVSVCALFRVPSQDWFIAMLGALPWLRQSSQTLRSLCKLPLGEAA